MMFNKIVLVDPTGLTTTYLDELRKFTTGDLIVYDDIPDTEEEIVRRISDAECVLVSWHTQISKGVIERCKNLKYVGMCCSLYDEKSANVAIEYAREKKIVVKGVRDYGDEGLVEYIISALISLIKGMGKHQWKDQPVELTNRTLGIIGLGTTGKMLADRARAFNMEVYYFNRSRKPAAEQKGIRYLPLDELLKKVEIISLHLPKNTVLLKNKEFEKFGNGKILINTSLGLTFQKEVFLNWIIREGNYALFDGDGIGDFGSEFSHYERIIQTEIVSGWTQEAKERLSEKVMDNVKEYIENSRGNSV